MSWRIDLGHRVTYSVPSVSDEPVSYNMVSVIPESRGPEHRMCVSVVLGLRFYITLCFGSHYWELGTELVGGSCFSDGMGDPFQGVGCT